MNRLPLHSADLASDDSLDRLLHEFYRSKMPRQFPSLPIPDAPSSTLAAPRSSLSRGRWVLAVCVAVVLLTFSLLLSSRPATTIHPSPVGLTNSNADTSHDHPMSRSTKTNK